MAVPRIDYLSRDFSGLRGSLLQYATQAFPQWQPASDGDLGVVLVDVFSYMGDILSYYTDRAQFENYLATATQRDSVLGIAYLLGYVPNSGTPAKGTVKLVTDPGLPATTVPAGTRISTNRIEALDGPAVFETDVEVILAADGGDNSPVPVTEGETEAMVKIGESTGQPTQVLLIPHTGVYRGSIQVFVEDNLGSTTFNDGINDITLRNWTPVDHLLNSEPNDTVFEVQYKDSSALVIFGDGINGGIPATGLKIYATYRHGAGAQGNVPAGAVRLLNDRAVPGIHVAQAGDGTYYSSAMTGGTDPESTDSIRYNAPRSFRTQERIVTKQDFIDAALGVEGVLKANASIGTFTSVTVYITGPNGGSPSDSLKALVAEILGGKTLAGVDVTVTDATVVPVNFGTSSTPVQIELEEKYSQTTARAAAERYLRSYVAGLPFGERLSVGRVYEVLAQVEGVKDINIPVMARDDASQTGTVTLTPREWEVFSVGTIHLTVVGGMA